ncbi:uncharacterized protein BDW47DRAFT_114303 [Aspergillus candidus]|uniref:Uncharacterized protein n=1 Tax=Aspergillus candidus TaxID=41067 RepID=A0A2I2EY18_ASPCN|nr:hypothetical protein BDW47DRAFT_114303 [Aspergillus candidus]PLB33259.1 hypothetical protein BDW47DRAFT_114303 [Aspergillus candidus]
MGTPRALQPHGNAPTASSEDWAGMNSEVKSHSVRKTRLCRGRTNLKRQMAVVLSAVALVHVANSRILGLTIETMKTIPIYLGQDDP